MAYDPAAGADHVIEKPAQYERWRDYTPTLTPPWTGKMLSWTYTRPRTLKPITRVLLEQEATKERSAAGAPLREGRSAAKAGENRLAAARATTAGFSMAGDPVGKSSLSKCE